MNKINRTVLAAVAASTMAVAVAAPAEAGGGYNRWRYASSTSTMEGCGPDGFDIVAKYKYSNGNIVINDILADNDDSLSSFPIYITVKNQAGVTVYSDNTVGVGDGKDYLWVKGGEYDHNGNWVPIGRSDSSPAGWTPLTAKSFTITASLVMNYLYGPDSRTRTCDFCIPNAAT